MLRRRIIAGAVALGLMMSSTAYAMWTQSLNVKNTIKAGELEFHAIMTDISKNQPYSHVVIYDDYANPRDDEMGIYYLDPYPGAVYCQRIDFFDCSSIGIKYKLELKDFDSKAMTQTYSIPGTKIKDVSLEELNKYLERGNKEFDQWFMCKVFSIEVKTRFNSEADEKLLKENERYKPKFILTASQFNQ